MKMGKFNIVIGGQAGSESKGKIQRNGQNFRMIKPQPLINRIYELINRINVRLKID